MNRARWMWLFTVPLVAWMQSETALAQKHSLATSSQKCADGSVVSVSTGTKSGACASAHCVDGNNEAKGSCANGTATCESSSGSGTCTIKQAGTGTTNPKTGVNVGATKNTNTSTNRVPVQTGGEKELGSGGVSSSGGAQNKH